jgi:hypothetical protein
MPRHYLEDRMFEANFFEFFFLNFTFEKLLLSTTWQLAFDEG